MFQPCTEIQGHSSEAQAPAAPISKSTANISSETTSDGKEIYQVGGTQKNSPSTSAPAKQAVTAATHAPAPAPVLEVDDLNQTVPVGTPCKRKGCHTTFVSDEKNRQGDGEGTVCHYHPLPVSSKTFATCLMFAVPDTLISQPYFREGSKVCSLVKLNWHVLMFAPLSKGYLCCKRRVLEFDEFLKIEGCQTGRHCFIPVVTEPKVCNCLSYNLIFFIDLL